MDISDKCTIIESGGWSKVHKKTTNICVELLIRLNGLYMIKKSKVAKREFIVSGTRVEAAFG